MAKARTNGGAKIKDTAPKPQQAAEPSSSAVDAAIVGHSLASPKMRKVTRRLKDLQDEQAKLVEMIHKLSMRKKKQQELLLRQQQYQQPIAISAPSHKNKSNGHHNHISTSRSDENLPVSDDESVAAHPNRHRHRNNHRNNANNSVVSSLASRAHSHDDDDDDDDEEDSDDESGFGYDDDDDDDASVMTENIYHYDARGRRRKDEDYNDDLIETETTAACFKNITGTNNHDNTNTDDNNKDQKKKKKHKGSTRVTIEWKRGVTYVPEANLAYDGLGGGGDAMHFHPTDLSLLVADDKEYWDDLSFSSGEDTDLAAAETDMPMVLDLAGNKNGDSDESVQSGLHSECSVSVAAAPLVDSNKNKTSKGAAKLSSSISVSSNRSTSSRQHRRDKSGGGLVPSKLEAASKTQNRSNHSAPYLYRRSNSMDESNSNSKLLNDSSSSTHRKEEDIKEKKEAPRRGRRPGKEDNSDWNDDCPPPLTTDMSLVDSKQLDDDYDGIPNSERKTKNGNNKEGAPPPVEIAFSDDRHIDDDGMESLGSAMCGVSAAQKLNEEEVYHTTNAALPTTISHKVSHTTTSVRTPTQAASAKKSTLSAAAVATATPSNNVTTKVAPKEKKTKKKKSKSKAK